MQRARRIGLTGGIGSGKSTVAQILAQAGAAIIDADAISRSLTSAGGLAIANNLDVVIPALETVTGATLWNKEIYYINELPSKVLPADVISIVSVSFVLTLLAALYPSWRASQVNPAEALRYE